MTEDEARQFELMRAVEVEDREFTLFTREDRVQADAQARSSGSIENRRGADLFLATRAQFASALLISRHPGIAGVLQRSHWPRWFGWAVPVAALAAGFLSNEFGTGKRLDLLALPLLGTVAWNLLVYVWMVLSLFDRRTGRRADPLSRALSRARGLGRGLSGDGTALQRAGGAFRSRWAAASATLDGARTQRTFHLAAALFACGLVAGIYLRALVIEYRAGWESTFLGPDAVRLLLSVVLGPASWSTGVPIPDAAGIAELRWTGPTTGGVNAASWILLYTATIVGIVVLPRLLLAFAQGVKALRLTSHFPVPGREDFYVRRLLRNAGEAPGKARVTPYAYRPDGETRRRLTEALRAALGDSAEVRFDEAINYGEEDEWLARHERDPREDYHIILFTLSTTPEEENHGALAAALAKRIAADRSGTMLAAIVDETPFRAHFAGQVGLDERVASRLEAWRRVMAGAAVAPISLDLSQVVDRSLAQRLESGLMLEGASRK